ncbi:hypothetical protein C9J01_18805 [Photobacterium rosenbergii]|uniref:Uncharacterized protein n=1 Tax=Photobacterium rosenbergii TaxID=294936 RepID=A0A2T3N9R8_9GAMM|nr:hypothetical protein [Photobacterium rosenbergii]PSW10263.1 hypothetical protein C9J01_18805 [Photobacterium rosenbergii]
MKGMKSVMILALSLLVACGGSGDGGGKGGGAGSTTPAPLSLDVDDQWVEQSGHVTLSVNVRSLSNSPVELRWTQVSGPNVEIADPASDTISFDVDASDESNDVIFVFNVAASGEEGHTASEEVNVHVNKAFEHNIMLRVVRVTPDWMGYDGVAWTTAVPTGAKTSTGLKYYEAAIWDNDVKAVHLYAFDNDYAPYSSEGWAMTPEERIAYRESYRVMKFSNMPSYESGKRGTFLRDAFSEIGAYLAAAYPDSDHHLMYSGHGGPGGALFEGLLGYQDAADFLAAWSGSLGRNLGVVDMGGPCNKGAYTDTKNFCQYADYYIASDLPNGGYQLDDHDNYRSVNPEYRYHDIFADSGTLKEALTKRIDLKRQAYLFAYNYMVEHEVEQANYLYSCHEFNTSFAPHFEELALSKNNYLLDDMMTYLADNGAGDDLVSRYQKVITHRADNRDFFPWAFPWSGMMTPLPGDFDLYSR